MTHAKLQIQHQPGNEKLLQHIALIGTVDADASRLLETLYVLPLKATAELNFAQVEWINSMGLAQLLKLFEHWQQRDINIRITNVNQMIGLLFHKTGLTNFLADGQINALTHSHHSAKNNFPPKLDQYQENNPVNETSDGPAVLQIQPLPSSESLTQQFELIGTIDVSAVEVLTPLYILPEGCTAELNFAQVSRVNSMGLAQLLKLFEHWQKKNIKIRVTNVNRMITVLFKMTGLTRFLFEGQKPSTETAEVASPTKPGQQKAAPETPSAPTPATEPKQAAGNQPATVLASASGTLQIHLLSARDALNQRLDFIGTIDVGAIEVLEHLHALPQNCSVELNFAQVQRVNSMGLAQLLKLFEHWQKLNIDIRIINVNRMIGVLFKMTGLNRFLSGEQTQTAAVNNQAQRSESPEPGTTIPPDTAPLNSSLPSAAQPVNVAAATGGDKLKLWVSAQSSQQMNGWYFFNTYLQRHLGREVHLELVHGAIGERQKTAEQMDIVYTKPFEATRLLLEHQFQPLLRPIDQTDEVTLLVRVDDPRQRLSAFQGGKVVTAAQDNFVYLLGRFLLEEDEAALSNMEYLFSGHDIKALQMLLKGSADILFMLSDTYRGLSGLTRKMLREIDQSETAFAFHMFSVAPHCAGLGDALSNVLLDMSLDSQGRQVLADLGIPGWIKPTQDECDMLVMLFNRYAVGAASH